MTKPDFSPQRPCHDGGIAFNHACTLFYQGINEKKQLPLVRKQRAARIYKILSGLCFIHHFTC